MSSDAMAAQQAAMNMAGVAGQLAMRDKLWPERDVEQKLQALRDQVVHLTHTVDWMREALQKMEQHEHGNNGLLVPPHDRSRDHPTGYYRHIPTSLRDKE